jgi:hypothetical protein
MQSISRFAAIKGIGWLFSLAWYGNALLNAYDKDFRLRIYKWPREEYLMLQFCYVFIVAYTKSCGCKDKRYKGRNTLWALLK